jgi:predicted transcriptional regulator
LEKKVADVIGNAAGALWKYLDKHGASSATKITKETQLDAKEVQRAIGWLAKEGKLTIMTKGRTETITLK